MDNIKDRRDALKAIAITGLAMIPALALANPNEKDNNSPDLDIEPKVDKIEQEFLDIVKENNVRLDEIKDLTAEKGPINREEANWNVLKQKALDLYSIAPVNGKFGPASTLTKDEFLKSIDADYKFSKLDQDDNFHYQHVEMLLDQAINILDRCIEYRNEWQQHYEKLYQIRSELTQYFLNDEIHDEEIKAGFYTLPYEESLSALNSEIANEAGYRKSGKLLQWVLDNHFNNKVLNEQSYSAQKVAWLSHLQSYEKPDSGNLLQHTFNKYKDTSPRHCLDAAFVQTWYNFKTQISTINAQKQTYTTYADSASQRIEGLRKRANWEKLDIDFKRRRTQVAKDLADAKVKAFVETGGALNFAEQLVQIKTRFTHDFREAIARIFACSDGMTKIYGYNAKLPATIDSLIKNTKTKTETALDECLFWVRDVSSWLTRFSQLDQNYVTSLSVKNLTDHDNQWQAGLKTGTFTFNVPDTFFPFQRHVRLRGLSVFIESVSGVEDLYECIITPPTNSFSKHLSDKQTGLDQTHIPRIRVGRITSRFKTYTPDIVGVSALHNVSPFNLWKIEVFKNHHIGDELKNIKDIQIDLYIAFRNYDKA